MLLILTRNICLCENRVIIQNVLSQYTHATDRRQTSYDASRTGRKRLRSAHRRQLDVPRYQRNTRVRRAFCIAGPAMFRTRFRVISETRLETFSGNN